MRSIIKTSSLIWITSFTLYLFTRFYLIENTPLFSDESLNIFISQDILNKNFTSPLSTGYLPVHFLIQAIFQLLPFSLITSSRLASVFWGLLGLPVFVRICQMLSSSSKRSVIVWASIFYITSPFFVFFQRQATQESAVIFFSLLIILTSLNYFLKKNLSAQIIFILAIIAALLTKTTTIFVIPGIFLLSLLLTNNHLKILTLANVSASLFITSLILLTPPFSPILHHHLVLSYLSSSQNISIADILSKFIQNFKIITSWTLTYLTWPVALLIVVTILKSKKTQLKLNIILLSWFIFSLLLLCLSVISPYPRYLVALLIPLYILLPINLFKLNQKKQIIAIFLLIPSIIFDIQLIINLKTAPLPVLDKWQYIQGWTSGYGFPEIGKIVENYQFQNQKILYVEDSSYKRAVLTMPADIQIRVFAQMRDHEAPRPTDLPLDGLILYNFWKPPESENIEIIYTYQKTSSESLYLVKSFYPL